MSLDNPIKLYQNPVGSGKYRDLSMALSRDGDPQKVQEIPPTMPVLQCPLLWANGRSPSPSSLGPLH